jgi:hypothetical protein
VDEGSTRCRPESDYDNDNEKFCDGLLTTCGVRDSIPPRYAQSGCRFSEIALSEVRSEFLREGTQAQVGKDASRIWSCATEVLLAPPFSWRVYFGMTSGVHATNCAVGGLFVEATPAVTRSRLLQPQSLSPPTHSSRPQNFRQFDRHRTGWVGPATSNAAIATPAPPEAPCGSANAHDPAIRRDP